MLPPKFLREFLQVRFQAPNLTPCLRFQGFVSQSPGGGVAEKKKKGKQQQKMQNSCPTLTSREPEENPSSSPTSPRLYKERFERKHPMARGHKMHSQNASILQGRGLI